MGASDSKRIQHPLTGSPFRDDNAHQAIKDLMESVVDTGYSEVTYLGSQDVDTITVWSDSGKTLRRMLTTFSYVSNQVSQEVSEIFAETDGTVKLATVTTVYTYNANKTLATSSTTITRP